MPGSIPKQVALYVFMHGGQTAYECRGCSMFLHEFERCTIHGPTDVIRGYGSCSYFIFGKSMGGKPMGEVNVLTSGYSENPARVGFSCKRCKYFDLSGDCRKLDKDSKGLTPGLIHPNACCNAWEADKERSKLSDERLGGMLRKHKAIRVVEAHTE